MTREGRIVSATAKATITLKVSGVGVTQMRFAVQHLLGAASFCRRVGEIEQANAGEQFGAFFDEILHASTACVMMTVASIEAMANELAADRGIVFKEHSKELRDLLWREFDRKPVLEKFDLALTLKGKKPIDRKKSPGRDIAALIWLRNGLVHFKPEWDDSGNGPHAKLSKNLNDAHRSPFLKSERLFPRAWASHACTRWAIDQAIDFDLMVFSALGLNPMYMKHLHRLKV